MTHDRMAAMSSVSTTPTPSTPTPKRRRSRWTQILGPLVSVAIVVGVFWYFLPQFTSISAVWASIQ
jgi:hypothetical protein